MGIGRFFRSAATALSGSSGIEFHVSLVRKSSPGTPELQDSPPLDQADSFTVVKVRVPNRVTQEFAELLGKPEITPDILVSEGLKFLRWAARQSSDGLDIMSGTPGPSFVPQYRLAMQFLERPSNNVIKVIFGRGPNKE
jgi:hypothetical protein